MAYNCDLGMGQRVHVENRDAQTIVTLSRSSAGQQQSQQSSVQTGEWQLPPTLFRTATGWVLRIEAAQRQTLIRLQSNSISVLTELPSMVGAEALPLQKTSESAPSTAKPIEPMKPMEPLKMGDMQMQMEPMQMQMGNMRMQMGKPSTQPAQQFCSQCGKQAGTHDRFCVHCGNKLSSTV